MELNSQDKMDATLREFLAKVSKDEDTSPFEITRKVEIARENTFDKSGCLKESQLVPIYREMVQNWIKIENMSGPKELVIFLTEQKLLNGTSKSPTGEITRIATMCSRIGLKFRL